MYHTFDIRSRRGCRVVIHTTLPSGDHMLLQTLRISYPMIRTNLNLAPTSLVLLPMLLDHIRVEAGPKSCPRAEGFPG